MAKATPATTTSTAIVSAAAGGGAGTEGWQGLPEGGAPLVLEAAAGEPVLRSRDGGLCSGGQRKCNPGHNAEGERQEHLEEGEVGPLSDAAGNK